MLHFYTAKRSLPPVGIACVQYHFTVPSPCGYLHSFSTIILTDYAVVTTVSANCFPCFVFNVFFKFFY